MDNLKWLIRPRFYVMLVVSAFFGALIGFLMALFWAVIYAGTNLIWKTIPDTLVFEPNTWWYIILVVMMGGVLVGLCQYYLGDYPHELQEEMKSFREEGRFDTAHIPQGMLTSFVSLAAGASLGPEAPLVGMGGGLSSLAADRVKKIAGDEWSQSLRRILLVVSILAGLVAFVLSARAFELIGSGGLFNSEVYQFEWVHLLWAVPASVIGIGAGYVFLLSRHFTNQLRERLGDMPLRRAILGAVVFAIIAAAFPLALFSGQSTLLDLQLDGADMALWVLLLSGLGKIIVISVLLDSGWKGGTFLPLMTGAAMLSLSLSVFVPELPTLVPIAAAMAASTAVTLQRYVLVFGIMLLLAPLSTIGVYAVAILLSVAAVRLVSPPVTTQTASH